MKTFKISNKFIILDITIALLPVILLMVYSLVTNINTTAIIAIFVSSIIMLCYHFYTLIKCYRYDKHTQVTISDNNVCYTHQSITIEFDITDISAYWHCTSSIIGHGYSVLKLRNQKCICITDLIILKDVYQSCKDRKIEIHRESDPFLLNLESQ